MNINFYLNDESETQIMCFYDQASNPFRGVGQIIHLDVEFLYPKLLENYSEEKKLEIYNDWEEKRNMFYITAQATIIYLVDELCKMFFFHIYIKHSI